MFIGKDKHKLQAKMAKNNFQGAILAGGKSSRMGEDKALLNWHGKTLLKHMQTVLTRAGASKVWISGDYDYPDSIADLKPNSGPLGGLYSISKTAGNGIYIIVPVDMPLIEIGQIKQLAAALSNSTNHNCAHYENNILPLAIRIDEQTTECISNLINKEKSLRSLKNLLKNLNRKILTGPSDKEFTFINCNSKKQWEELQNETAHQ